MEETVKERILAFIKAKSISQKKFEEAAGLSNGYVNNLKSAPSSTILQRIFGAYPDLNEQWLLTGTGPMLKDGGGEGEQGGEPSLATLVGEIAAQRRLTEAAQEQVSRSQEQIDRLLTLLEAERGVKPKKSVG